jgi:hypothetical protein
MTSTKSEELSAERVIPGRRKVRQRDGPLAQLDEPALGADFRSLPGVTTPT